MVAMEHNPNSQFSEAHLTNLNLNNFKMIESMGLKIIASRSPWMALPPYQISWNYQAVQKLLVGDTQTDLVIW
jgi:hypothetical protein